MSQKGKQKCSIRTMSDIEFVANCQTPHFPSDTRRYTLPPQLPHLPCISTKYMRNKRKKICNYHNLTLIIVWVNHQLDRCYTYIVSQLGRISVFQIIMAWAMFSSWRNRSFIIFFLLCASFTSNQDSKNIFQLQFTSYKWAAIKPASIHIWGGREVFYFQNFDNCLQGHRRQIYSSYPWKVPPTCCLLITPTTTHTNLAYI